MVGQTKARASDCADNKSYYEFRQKLLYERPHLSMEYPGVPRERDKMFEALRTPKYLKRWSKLVTIGAIANLIISFVTLGLSVFTWTPLFSWANFISATLLLGLGIIGLFSGFRNKPKLARAYTFLLIAYTLLSAALLIVQGVLFWLGVGIEGITYYPRQSHRQRIAYFVLTLLMAFLATPVLHAPCIICAYRHTKAILKSIHQSQLYIMSQFEADNLFYVEEHTQAALGAPSSDYNYYSPPEVPTVPMHVQIQQLQERLQDIDHDDEHEDAHNNNNNSGGGGGGRAAVAGVDIHIEQQQQQQLLQREQLPTPPTTMTTTTTTTTTTTSHDTATINKATNTTTATNNENQEEEE